MKNPKLIIGIIVIVILLIIFFVVLANAKKVTTTKGGTTISQPSILDTLSNIFSPHSDSTNANTSTGGGDPFYCKVFPKLCPNPDCFNKTKDHPGCLSSKPGYNCKNELDSYC